MRSHSESQMGRSDFACNSEQNTILSKGYSAERLNSPVRPGGSGKVFENLAVSNWQLATSQSRGTWHSIGIWQGFATLCRLGFRSFTRKSGARMGPVGTGFGIGWPLGGPSVAQGPPKGHARATQASIRVSVFVCNESAKSWVGVVGFADLDRSTPGYTGRSR